MPDHLLLPSPQGVGSRRSSVGGRPIDRDRPVHGRNLRAQLSAATAAAPPRRGGGVDPNLVFKLHVARRPNDSSLVGRNLEFLGETADSLYFVLSSDGGSALARAIDAYTQTGDLSSLLNLIDGIELYGPQDRRGPGLDSLDLSGLIQVDVKIWAADTYAQARSRTQLVERVVELAEGRVDLRSVSTRRTILRVTVPGTALDELLDVSVVEQVRTPPVPFLDFRDWRTVGVDQLERIEVSSATVGILDDLPAVEHPLLSGLIESVDLIGPADYPWQQAGQHCNEVAGRVLFPRLHEELRDLSPITAYGTVRVARILEPDPHDPARTRFAQWAQPHELVEEGIRRLHDRYGVKVFNLSVGYAEPYNDAHLGALTETIDDLVRELDIVVVVPTGNVEFHRNARTPSGHHVGDDYPHYLDTEEHRLSEPGPSGLAVTVGSVALSDAPAEMNPPRLGWRVVAEVDRVSPFSRTGPGTGPNSGRLNKPEFVHYGGNTAINDAGMIAPNELGSSIVSTALLNDPPRLFAACNGTSYAAPAVARVAADIQFAYPGASANLIRVLLGIGASPPPPALAHQTDARHRAHYGLGIPTTERALTSGARRATMIYDGRMPINDVQIHPVPIPAEFRLGRGQRRTITATLAYDPPVRHQRREYLAASMQVDLYRQTDVATLQRILCRQPETAEPLIKDRRRLNLEPGSDAVRSSTLQMRSWSATNSFVNDDETFYAAVTHTATAWARDDQEYLTQNYALAVTLEDQHLDQVDLHQLLSIALPARVRLRR